MFLESCSNPHRIASAVCASKSLESRRVELKDEYQIWRKKLERIEILSPSRLTSPKSGSSLRISFYISTRLHSRFTASPRFTTSPLSHSPLESDSSVDLGVAERKRRRSTRLHSAFSYDNKRKLCFSISLSRGRRKPRADKKSSFPSFPFVSFFLLAQCDG